MKKMFLSFAAVAILAFSCGTQTETPADASQVDSLGTVVGDTLTAQPDSLMSIN